MQFGFNMPTSGGLTGPDALARLATVGGAMGYAFARVRDHVVIPVAIANDYPYTDGGAFPWRAGAAA